MKYNGVIERKLDLIAQRVSKLRSRSPLTTQELEKDFFLFRNLIVHRYEQIEAEILVTIVNKHLDDFDRFAREIQEHESE